MIRFSNDWVEACYQAARQEFLAKQDSYAGAFLGCCGLLWMAQLAATAPLEPFLMLRAAAVTACCLLPPLLRHVTGERRYARCRLRAVLLVRLAFLLSPLAAGSYLAITLSPAMDVWHAAGRLFLISGGFSLLGAPLGFVLDPLPNAAVHVVAVAVAMWRVRASCSCCYLEQLPARESLARIGTWLGHCSTVSPIPLPAADLSPEQDPCILLAHWLQATWLCVLPCLMVYRWEVMARKEFVRSLPREALPQTERMWWAGFTCPTMWQLLCLLMPALSLAIWRILALSQASSSSAGCDEGGAGQNVCAVRVTGPR